jgi:alpha-beta hydrolase superfamily lysophospholipase
MASTVATALAPDGTTLRIRSWVPGGAGRPKAVLLLVPGLGEHSGRYEHVGEGLAASGYQVESFDLRGTGASGGRRMWVDRWDRVHEDLEARLAAARAVADGRPVVLMGHSLGGLIALGYAIGDRPKPDLLILSAPGLEDGLAAWKKRLAFVLDRVAPNLRINAGIGRGLLASKPRAGFVYVEDPLVETSSTVHGGAEGLREQARVRTAVDGLERLPMPTLVVHGGDDHLVPTRSSERLERLPGVTRIVYPGLRHETHNEADSTTVADIVRWLDQQVPVVDSGHN